MTDNHPGVWEKEKMDDNLSRAEGTTAENHFSGLTLGLGLGLDPEESVAPLKELNHVNPPPLSLVV